MRVCACAFVRRAGSQLSKRQKLPVLFAYDDDGHGTLAAGATIALAGATATAGPDGSATLAAPAAPGRYEVTATAPGDVTGFPAEVEVA